MKSKTEMEAVLTAELAARGLQRANGELAFTHKGQAVALKADKSIYRGFYVSVLERGYTVREFRSGTGAFEWAAIAESIVDVAERRLAPHPGAGTYEDDALGHATAGDSLPAGDRPPSAPSLEPSPDRLGHIRVRLQDLHLDPATALRLCAAVTRALAAEQPAVPRGAQPRVGRAAMHRVMPPIPRDAYAVFCPSDAARHI